MHYYIDVLKKYATFKGRASRSEFWIFGIVNFIIIFAIVAVGGMIAMSMGKESAPITAILAALYAFATFIPGIAVTVRRLHDTNRSGFWFFIPCVPIIGGIWYFILMVLDSTPGDNSYGPNPKGVSAIVPTPSTPVSAPAPVAPQPTAPAVEPQAVVTPAETPSITLGTPSPVVEQHTGDTPQA